MEAVIETCNYIARMSGAITCNACYLNTVERLDIIVL